jgi:hypothetical protein
VAQGPTAVLIRACHAGTKVIDIASAFLQYTDPHAYQHFTSAQWKSNILETELSGGAFLPRWPTIDSAYYLISVAPSTSLITTGDHVKTVNGDVIVTVSSSGLTYDATVHPDAACAAA